MEREASLANYCPIERPLIQSQPIEQEPMSLSPPEKYQAAIANAKSKKDALQAVIEFAISRGLYSNQDILEEEVRTKFREMMGRLP